ncbi:MAG TPA: aminopeptidase [Candidatus Didemnitutus sp.]|nr:aminopeptidase [Candidatus Didemnitutus sp.]
MENPPPDFSARLAALGHVLIRVGVNLRVGQRLLIAEPHELQGVAREAAPLVDAARRAAQAAGASGVSVTWGDPVRLRQLVGTRNWPSLRREIAANTAVLRDHVDRGDALLFLQSSHLDLMRGVPAGDANEFRHLVWEHFGPVAQELTAGATNWCVSAAPVPAWADFAYAELPAPLRLDALWTDLFDSMRVSEVDPIGSWAAHLQALRERAETLNRWPTHTRRLVGGGTDLTVGLPEEHRWCTACLTTRSGHPFVANLPTEEIFTAPHRDSAHGMVRVSRPINFGGTVIDGIELEFRRGRVIAASARQGTDHLQRLLETDEGAARLGEIALVPGETALGRTRRLFFNPLLDENATSHVALGEGYAFCLRSPNPSALNRSLIHVDLPVAIDPEKTGVGSLGDR